MGVPLVSVVIPTYNQPIFLREALESVFAQSFTDYEVIVVNDGSTEETARELARYGNRLRVFTQVNQGIGCARNRGMSEARGRYIAFLDHDDVWHPEKLETQVTFMRAHPDCVGSSVPFAYTSSPDKVNFDLSIRDSEGIVRDALHVFAGGVIFLLTSALMIDRLKVGDLRYATRRECIEDLPLQLGLLMRGPVGVAGDRILVTYRVHASNASKSARIYENGILLLREISRDGGFEPTSERDRRSLEEFIAFYGRISAVRLLQAGLRRRSFQCYIREFSHQVRARRVKFLLLFPLLGMMPRFILRLRWSGDTVP